MDYPRFTGPNARCPKCGNVGAATSWVSSRVDKHGDELPEHMERKCGTCGYFWRERPLDHEC